MKLHITVLLAVFCISLALSESSADLQASKVQTDTGLYQSLYNAALDEGFIYETGMKKRSMTKAAMAAKGRRVMKKLLTGVKKVQTTKNARYYWKIGDRQTALNDFNAVKPVVSRPNVNYIGRRRLNDVLIGRVGDRRLVLMLDGDPYYKYDTHSVVLEIRSATDPKPDIIVYKREK